MTDSNPFAIFALAPPATAATTNDRVVLPPDSNRPCITSNHSTGRRLCCRPWTSNTLGNSMPHKQSATQLRVTSFDRRLILCQQTLAALLRFDLVNQTFSSVCSQRRCFDHLKVQAATRSRLQRSGQLQQNRVGLFVLQSRKLLTARCRSSIDAVED